MEFSNATAEQIIQIFKQFYKPNKSIDIPKVEASGINGNNGNHHGEIVREEHVEDKGSEKTVVGDSNLEALNRLAERFGEIIPSNQIPLSSIQAYLMRFKKRPEEAVAAAAKWVEDGFPQNIVSEWDPLSKRADHD